MYCPVPGVAPSHNDLSGLTHTVGWHPPLVQDLRAEDYTYTLSPEEVLESIAGTDALLARGVQDEEDIKKVGIGWQQH